jgi:hypothetical protein
MTCPAFAAAAPRRLLHRKNSTSITTTLIRGSAHEK